MRIDASASREVIAIVISGSGASLKARQAAEWIDFSSRRTSWECLLADTPISPAGEAGISREPEFHTDARATA